jgi:flagellar motor switch protein FliM
VEKVLTQDEIDQLFRKAQGTAPKAAPSAPARMVKDCDFRQAGQLGKEQVRQVTLLHEAFAPNLANSLGAYLRVGLQVSLVAVEQLVYSEFLTRIPEQTYFATCQLLPLEEISGIQLDLALAFPMIDLLLGGPGQGLAEPRDLTEIEEQILESVSAVVCRELQTTWHSVLPLEFQPGQRVKSSQIITMIPHTEHILNLSFELRLTETRGNLNLVFPAAISNMLLRKLAQQGMLQRRRPSAESAVRLRELLQDCKFTVELELTRIPLRIREVVDMLPGEILPLRHSLRESMSVTVNGHSIFSGVPVSCGPLRGGLIQEICVTKEPAEKTVS